MYEVAANSLQPSLTALKAGAAQGDVQAAEETARQFEAVFAGMLTSSMRKASFGDSMFPGQNEMYRDLYDKELASEMSKNGGLGIADMMMKQWRATGVLPAENAPAAKMAATEPAMQSASLTQRFASAGAPVAPSRGYSLARYLPTTNTSPAVTLPATTDTAKATSPRDTVRAHAASTGVAPAPVAFASAALGDDAKTAPPRASARLVALESALSSLGGIDRAPKSALLDPALPNLPEMPQPRLDAAITAYTSDAKPGTPEAFVATVWPHAQKAAAALGVDPRMLVAQAALETGWGKSGMAQREHNLFGIKAGRHYAGNTANYATREFVNGQPTTENAAFRSYGGVAQSFDDYVQLLKNSPRYADVLKAGRDGTRFASALQRAGYATDPRYAAKLSQIAHGPTLNRAIEKLESQAPRSNEPWLASQD